MAEEWRIIAVAPRYEVSDSGRVRNIRTGHIISQFLDRNGDVCVSMWRYEDRGLQVVRKGGAKRVRILVMHAFYPEIPASRSMVIRQRNGNRKDCSFKNLYYQHRRELTKENWAFGKMEEARKKNPFTPGHRLGKPFPKGYLHPRWNPKSPAHLKHLRKIALEFNQGKYE